MSATAVDLAWAAGFLDGEAWIGVAGKGSGGRAGLPRIEVSQNVRAPLDRLAEMFGGRVYRRRRQPTERSTRQESYLWKLEGACHARRVLPLVIPFMLVKADDAERTLAIANTITVRQPRRKVPG